LDSLLSCLFKDKKQALIHVVLT